MNLFKTWFGPKGKVEMFKDVSRDLHSAVNDLKKVYINYKKKVDNVGWFIQKWDKGYIDKLSKVMELEQWTG